MQQINIEMDLTVYNHANNFREWIFPLALCISGSFFNISRPFLKEIPAAAGVSKTTLHVETQKNSYAKDKLKTTAYAPPRFYANRIHASLFFENTDDGKMYVCMIRKKSLISSSERHKMQQVKQLFQILLR